MSLEVDVRSTLIHQKKQNPNTVFGVLCIIGSSIMRFMFPSIYSFHTLCIYQVSYIKHNGGDANVIYTMFYYPPMLYILCSITQLHYYSNQFLVY